MATIQSVLKGRETYSVTSDHTVLQAAQYMVERNVGAVPVVKGSELVGIFSERDIMKRVLVEGRNPQATRVADVMTQKPLTVKPDEDLEHCLLIMKQHGFRHLPVCEGSRLVGFLSLRDLLMHDLDEKDTEVRHMRAYIHSTPVE